MEENQLDMLQIVQFECPRYSNPCLTFCFSWIPFSHFQPSLSLSLSGVIRIGLPSMRANNLKMFWDKFSLICWKWSNLNALGKQTLMWHPFLVNSRFSFSVFAGEIRNGHPIGSQEIGNFLGWNQLNRLKTVQFECHRYSNPCVTSIFGEFPFLIFRPTYLWGNKNWASKNECLKLFENLGWYQLKRLQMDQFSTHNGRTTLGVLNLLGLLYELCLRNFRTAFGAASHGAHRRTGHCRTP